MPKKSRLEFYYNSIFFMKQNGHSLNAIAKFIADRYRIKCSPSMIKSLLDVRKRQGIKPNVKDMINILRKNDGSRNFIDLGEI